MFGFLKGVLKNWSMLPCYHLKVFKVKGNIKPKTEILMGMEKNIVTV